MPSAFSRPGDRPQRRRLTRRAAGSALLVAGIAFSSAGCLSPGSVPAMLGHLPGLGRVRVKAEHEALRKKVEADAFPTAAQAGL